MASGDIRPFRVEVPEDVLDDLRERLARTRWPDQIPGSGWSYGTDLEYLQDLCDHWRTKFDWRAQEDRFNRWPHFVTQIDGQQVHFIHARSDNADALPLIISHERAMQHRHVCDDHCLDGLHGLGRGVPRRHRAVARAVPRGRAVAARLRMV